MVFEHETSDDDTSGYASNMMETSEAPEMMETTPAPETPRSPQRMIVSLSAVQKAERVKELRKLEREHLREPIRQ